MLISYHDSVFHLLGSLYCFYEDVFDGHLFAVNVHTLQRTMMIIIMMIIIIVIINFTPDNRS